jgi:hypothetical protein
LPFAAPLIVLAGLPFLSNHLEKANLEKAKQKFMPELERVVDGASKVMRENLLSYLGTEIRGLQSAAEVKYRQLLSSARSSFNNEISARSQATSIVRSSISVFEEAIAHLNSLETRLFSLVPKELEGEAR